MASQRFRRVRTGQAQQERDLHARRLTGLRLLHRRGVLVGVDEQQAGPAGGVAQRRDRREQKRTVRAVEQRETAGAQTVPDAGVDGVDHRQQCRFVDEAGPRALVGAGRMTSEVSSAACSAVSRPAARSACGAPAWPGERPIPSKRTPTRSIPAAGSDAIHLLRSNPVRDAQAVIVSLWTWNAAVLSRPASRTLPGSAAASSREGPRSKCRRVCRNQLGSSRVATGLRQMPNLIREHLRPEGTPARGRPVRPAR